MRPANPPRPSRDDDPLWFQVMLEFLLDVTFRLLFRSIKVLGRVVVFAFEFFFELF
ncbi:hypothetical protein [Hymenobacter oligotrophus]|uniref:hypothetical protein n=1 Tax=Hymenobacter oligotrophus TaxID=2319843 RepID=UPI0013C2E5F1|nr:hypothetical protein [Hymenobacter oligotrophus]